MQETTSASFAKDQLDKRIEAFATVVGISTAQAKDGLSQCGISDADDNAVNRSLQLLDNPEFLTFSDLCVAFVDTKIISRSVLRMGIPALTGKNHLAGESSELTKVAESIQSMVSSNRPKADWKDEELLERYDRTEVEIARIISERTKGRPCIIFDRSGNVMKEPSLKLMKTARRQGTPNRFQVDGQVVRVYPSGQFPPELLEESPLSIGTPLVDGYCGATNTDWSKISHEGRVLARIYVNHVETVKLSVTQLREVCTNATLGVQHFRKMYPEAALRYDEMEAADRLPKLRMSSATCNESIQQSSTDKGI